jgi:hypothetical protein
VCISWSRQGHHLLLLIFDLATTEPRVHFIGKHFIFSLSIFLSLSLSLSLSLALYLSVAKAFTICSFIRNLPIIFLIKTLAAGSPGIKVKRCDMRERML